MFLKNRNISSKIKRSKVTNYAALIFQILLKILHENEIILSQRGVQVPVIFFVLNMLSALYVCCIYSSALQTRFYHGSKQYEIWSDWSLGTSLIWVHIVCNTGYPVCFFKLFVLNWRPVVVLLLSTKKCFLTFLLGKLWDWYCNKECNTRTNCLKLQHPTCSHWMLSML